MDRTEPQVQTNSSKLNTEADAAKRLFGGDFLKNHKRTAAVLAAASLTLTLAACGTSAKEGPEPTETTTQAPTVAGTSIEAPVETTEPTPVDSEVTTELDKPLLTGPFGNEYAPLHSTNILETTVPMETLEAMDYTDFALQPVQDRLNYLFTRYEEDGKQPRNLYFGVDDNFVPDLAIASWDDAGALAFQAEDPNECAKLAIADMVYTMDFNTNGISEAASETAETWKSLCETKVENTVWKTGLFLAEEHSIRKEEQTAPGIDPQIISVVTYDVYEGQTVIDQRTVEMYEYTIQRPDGSVVVGYAQGRDV